MNVHLCIFLLSSVHFSIGQSNHCNVTEKKYATHFDFSALTDDTTDYTIFHEANAFLTLQLCKPLKKPCNGLEGYALCYSKNGQEYAIGKYPPEIIPEFGGIIFRYTGQECQEHFNYSVDIKMICDWAADDGSAQEIQLVPNRIPCQYNMEWRSTRACAKEEKMKCVLEHESDVYDLTPLINYSDNYEVRINHTYSVILNVCHSLLLRPNSCQPDNGACLVIKGNESFNLGTLSNSLKYDEVDKSLSLSYINGSICTGIKRMQATITFICDEHAIGTRPKYVRGTEDCHYQFRWVTIAACSIQDLEKKYSQKKNATSCSLKHPNANFTYNFTPLMDFPLNFYTRGSSNPSFVLQICMPLIVTQCIEGSGACRTRENLSGGMANSDVLWKSQGPYLNYTNGSPCKKTNSYTLIEFHCGDMEEHIIIPKRQMCHDIIRVTTQLACLVTPKPCVTVDKTIDLSSLILKSSSYLAKSADSELHINICHPLVEEGHVSCPDYVYICRFTKNHGQLSNATSLGLASNSPTLGTDGTVNLIYDGEALCDDDQERKVGSNVSFVCDVTKGKGMPNYKGYRNCTHFFEWKTELACGKIDSELDEENCSLTNRLGDVQSLSFVQKALNAKFNEYDVFLCGIHKCQSGYICKRDYGFGTHMNARTDYSTKTIEINFTQGAECENGSRAKSAITLICSERYYQRRPQIIVEAPCNIEFQWTTWRVCYKVNPSSNKSSIWSGRKIVWTITGVILSITLIIGLMLMFFKKKGICCFKVNNPGETENENLIPLQRREEVTAEAPIGEPRESQNQQESAL